MGWQSLTPSFGYTVTRPYPYRWFPWVTIIGGIVATVLFSLINVAATGYELTVLYTSDPNTTLSDIPWTERGLFSWVNKVSASCEPQTLPVGSQLFTNKLSLPYTLEGVWQNGTTNNLTVLPSLRYHNNTLKNCSITTLRLDLDSTERTVKQYNDDPWGAAAKVYVTCSVDNDNTPTWFNLSVEYDIADASENRRQFLVLDNSTKASLWWGQSLLSWTYFNLTTALAMMPQVTFGEDPTLNTFRRASFEVNPGNGTITDMTDPTYFGEVIRWMCLASNSAVLYICTGMDTRNPDYAAYEPDNVWYQAHDYALALYSSVLADVGQNNTDNVLTNSVLLQYYSERFNSSDVEPEWLRAGPARSSYSSLKNSLGPLGITPSTIYAQYFCQIPKLKPVGSLLVSVIIADLVFLQALWKIFTWSTTSWIEAHDPSARSCSGCLSLRNGGFELADSATRASPGLKTPSSGSFLRHRLHSDSEFPLISPPLRSGRNEYQQI